MEQLRIRLTDSSGRYRKHRKAVAAEQRRNNFIGAVVGDLKRKKREGSFTRRKTEGDVTFEGMPC
jgi:hypothetical protein